MREFKKQFAVKRGVMISIQSPDMIAAAENDGWEAGAGALQDVSVAPEFDAMQLRERIHLLAPLMARLNAAQREVLNLRYIDGLTLEEIGKRRKVTRERIRQIEAAALRKLRRMLECRKQENE